MKSNCYMSLRPAKRRSNLSFSRNSHLKRDGFVVVPFLLAMTWITACLPLNATLPTAAPTPTETPLQTPTIVWFPPTATPTLLIFPTYTSTPVMNPGIGAVTLTDNFSDPSDWDTASSSDGTAAVSRNRLSLAVQPGMYILSQRHDLVVGDFYAEITARPSLCRGDDRYGLIVRNVGRSYYRFALSCNGQVQAERVNTRGIIVLHEPIASGDVPPGAPGEVTIGVWAVGSELRLFLNGRYQFGFTDTSYSSGAFGVFVLSQGTDPVSVTFSDLKVYDVDYVLPTKTPRP